MDQVPDVLGGPHLRTVAMPRDTNASGAIFGGWTLSQMDLAGGTFAAQHAKGRVATASIEAMRFLRPVAVGDEVSCYCSLEGTDAPIVVKQELGLGWWLWGYGRDSQRSHPALPGWVRIFWSAFIESAMNISVLSTVRMHCHGTPSG